MDFEIGQKVRVIPTHSVYPNEEGVVIEIEETDMFLVRLDNHRWLNGLHSTGYCNIKDSSWFADSSLEHITDLEIAIREGRE